MKKEKKAKISVRNLVEFILCSGSIDASQGRFEPDAMQEGSRLHRKIQKEMGPEYKPEVSLSYTQTVQREGEEFEICVEGRADGVIHSIEDIQVPQIMVTVDEIKCLYADLSHLKEMIPIHRAQAMCYAYMVMKKENLARISIQLTYCNIETETIKQFKELFQTEILCKWYSALIEEYCKWVAWQYHWTIERNASLKKLLFPFPYRPGQKDLAAGVYRTIIREKKLFLEAPTGVGKTISTVFPTVKAMGEGVVEKIFYLTAKTITRTVAEDTFRLLVEHGAVLKVVTITAKDKICILEKAECNPQMCKRANGHYDRVNDAVYDMLTNESGISRELIEQYAKKHCVCPFEMCLDVTLWADGIVCDYNYAFDPHVYLRRFFANEKKQDYVFLIDEAHNLVDRAREMYSASLVKEDIQAVKRKVKSQFGKLAGCLEACNRNLLLLKRECESCEVWENAGPLVLNLMRLVTEMEEFLQIPTAVEGREELLSLYFNVRNFLFIHDLVDENYLIYTDYNDAGEFRIKLACMDPSKNLLLCLNKGKSTIFFSATLIPIKYYMEQLGGKEDDYAVYAPSPFDSNKRLLMVGPDVSTKYTRRTDSEYEKIIHYIITFTQAKTGNYLVFFPSYQMMQNIAELSGERISGLVLQKSNMHEEEKEAFLESFSEQPKETKVGFCVMGGIFSEGIDLKKDRLIGAVIVGTGLPMVGNERELFRMFYEERSGNGFSYAYLYPGMNKVLQSAGRVIRTQEDLGVILLLDERFLNTQYKQLFPKEWFPFEIVRQNTIKEKLDEFWQNLL